ncbi:hypothetical protein [Streptomyces werraensis]|uniref:hypothetical protein n=1 Tax=Streptomyces werraensis TaxID=68284 RepID=UPI00343F4BC7
MPEIRADKIGLETGTYVLPCGCRIYVHFPGGRIHLSGNASSKCPDLSALWSTYWASCRNGHNWTSLNNYLACLRHIGAWQGRLTSIERDRDRYPNPADSHDYPTAEKEQPSARVAS